MQTEDPIIGVRSTHGRQAATVVCDCLGGWWYSGGQKEWMGVPEKQPPGVRHSSRGVDPSSSEGFHGEVDPNPSPNLVNYPGDEESLLDRLIFSETGSKYVFLIG